MCRGLLEADRDNMGALVENHGPLHDVRGMVRSGVEPEGVHHETTSRFGGCRKPALLQPGECPVAAQGSYRRVDRFAKIGTVIGESDAELLAGRNLHGDAELRTVPDQPGDYREQ